MTPTIAATRRTAVSALALTLGSAALAWLLFIAGRYVELVDSAEHGWVYDSPERVTYAQFFTLVAIVVVGLGALISKRRLARLRAEQPERSRLVDPVSACATVFVSVAAGLATWVVFVLFMSGFLGGGTDPAPLARLVNLYVPIVLYTALVVTLILAGFVFVPAPQARAVASSAPANEDPASAEAGSAQAASDQPDQRSTALAYSVPIIAAAIALVFGLVVYDLTRTTLEVWIWVVILVIIGGGVLVGTKLAGRAARASEPEPPVVGGARVLNFLLSVVFAIVVPSMALGYGNAAVYALNSSPSLSISLYSEKPVMTEGSHEFVPNDAELYFSGSDLQRGSTATLTLTPEATEIVSKTVGRDGWVDASTKLPAKIEPGDYDLVAEGVARDGKQITATLKLSVDEQGRVHSPTGELAASTDEKSRILPITPAWIFNELLPAAVLLALALALIAATLTGRNRDR